MIEQDSIGARLKLIRQYFKFSQGEFAERLKITQQSYSLLEKNKRSPNIKILEFLSRKLEIDLNWLVNGLNEMFMPENFILKSEGNPEKEDEDIEEIDEDKKRRFKFYLRKIESLFLEKSKEMESKSPSV